MAVQKKEKLNKIEITRINIRIKYFKLTNFRGEVYNDIESTSIKIERNFLINNNYDIVTNLIQFNSQGSVKLSHYRSALSCWKGKTRNRYQEIILLNKMLCTIKCCLNILT